MTEAWGIWKTTTTTQETGLQILTRIHYPQSAHSYMLMMHWADGEHATAAGKVQSQRLETEHRTR